MKPATVVREDFHWGPNQDVHGLVV